MTSKNGFNLEIVLLAFGAIQLACGGGSEGPSDAPDAGAEECTTDAECSDGIFCNGDERCAPSDPDADGLGCVFASSMRCMPTQSCDEEAERCVSDCSTSSDADGDGVDAMECGGGDCDDSDPRRFPGNTEICDADDVDEDCDPTTFGMVDMDRDDFEDASCCNVSGSTVICGRDCDDSNPAVFPGAAEFCDGLDNDCDNLIDGPPASSRCPVPDGATAMVCREGQCEVNACATLRDDCDEVADNGCEVDLGTDIGNCGACAMPCPEVDNGTGRCDLGSCTVASCNVGFHICGDQCADNTSIDSCGANCSPCAPPANSTASCDGSECGYTCNPDTIPTGGTCQLPHPRLVAPLSTARVTSHTPTFRVELPSGATGAHIQVCTDVDCAEVVAEGDIGADSGQLTNALAQGTYFWRAASSNDESVSTVYSPSWLIRVPATSAAVDTSWGSMLDANMDGNPDLAVGDPRFDVVGGLTDAGAVRVYLGSDTGLPIGSFTRIDGPLFGARFGSSVEPAGDVDGDGRTDLIVGAAGVDRTYVLLAANDFEVSGAFQVDSEGPSAGLGDVNGDGYADVAIGSTTALDIFYGSSTGLSASMLQIAPGGELDPGSLAAGDVNGDGYSDLVASFSQLSDGEVAVEVGGFLDVDLVTQEGAPELRVHYGGAMGIRAGADAVFVPSGASYSNFLPVSGSITIDFPLYRPYSAGLGDTNGDGYAEIGYAIAGLRGNIGKASVSTSGAAAELIEESNADRPVWVLFGGAGSPTDRVEEISNQGQPFGSRLGGLGDIDADSFDDIFISAGTRSVRDPVSEVFVLRGGDGTFPAFGRVAPRNDSGGLLSVPELSHIATPLHDIDGDGASDFAISFEGAPGFFQLYAGNAYGLRPTPTTVPLPAAAAGLRVAHAPPTDNPTRVALLTAAGARIVLPNFSGPVASYTVTPRPGAQLKDIAMLSDTHFVVSDDGPGAGAVSRGGGIEVRSSGGELAPAILGTMANEMVGLSLAAFPDRLAVGASDYVDVYPHDGTQLMMPAQRINAAGQRVVRLGDVTGDGVEDLGVGEAMTSVHAGTATSFASGPSVMINGRAGRAGDLNGDGVGDIVVYGGVTGVLNVHLGATGGPSENADVSIAVAQASLSASPSYAALGDLNGDGFEDVALGQRYARDALLRPDTGVVYVLFGAADPADFDLRLVHFGADTGDGLGAALACADLNQDSLIDCIGLADNLTDSVLYVSGPSLLAHSESGLFFASGVAAAQP